METGIPIRPKCPVCGTFHFEKVDIMLKGARLPEQFIACSNCHTLICSYPTFRIVNMIKNKPNSSKQSPR